MMVHRARSPLLWACVVAAFVSSALSDLVAFDRIPLFRDTLFFFVPYKRLVGERIAQCELPLWNPYIYMGTPLLGSLVSGALYPPSWLLAVLPFPEAFNALVVLHYGIGAFGMWTFLRAVGVGSAARAIGSLAFTVGGFSISLMSLTNHLQGAVWAPWILFFWRRFGRQSSIGPWLGATIFTAVQAVAGSPEMFLLTVCVTVASNVFLARGVAGSSRAVWLGFITSSAVVAVLTAVQTMPTLEYVANSGRQSALPLAEVTTWSVDPVSLVQFVLPHSASSASEPAFNGLAPMLESQQPWLLSLYIGLAPLAFAIAGFVGSQERALWGTLAVAGMALSLGRHLPVLPSLYAAAPGLFGKFRYPEKFFLLVHLAACVSAAHAAEAILRGERVVERSATATAAALFVATAAVVAVRELRPDLYLSAIATVKGNGGSMTTLVPLALDLAVKATRAATILAMLVTLLIFHRWRIFRPSTLGVLLALVTGVDLVSVHRNLNLSTSWRSLDGQAELFDVTSLRESRGRLFLYSTVANSMHGVAPEPLRGLEPLLRGSLPAASLEDMYRSLWRARFLDAPMVDQVETLSGNDAIARASDNALRKAIFGRPRPSAIKLLRTFSAAVLIGLEPLGAEPDLERVEAKPPSPFFVYRLAHPLPTAYLAFRLRSAATDSETFDEIASENFEPGRDAIVSALPAGWRNAPAEQAREGHVNELVHFPERVELAVEAPRQSLVVLNDSYFPGWHAYLDDAPVEILRVNAIVRGVVVPPGVHRVEFCYRPRSVRVGALISAFGLVVLAGLLCRAWYTSSAAMA